MENEGKQTDKEEKKTPDESTSDSKQNTEENKADDKKADDTPDYKKMFEDNEEELKKARFKLAQKNIDDKKNKNEKNGKKADEEDSSDKEEDSDGEEGQVDVPGELEKFKREMRQDAINEELSKLSTDADEMKLIRQIYDNKITPSGFDRESIKRDLEDAQLLANKPRIGKIFNELKAAGDSKKATDKGNSGGSQKIDGDTFDDVALSADDMKVAKSFGLTKDDIAKSIKN